MYCIHEDIPLHEQTQTQVFACTVHTHTHTHTHKHACPHVHTGSTLKHELTHTWTHIHPHRGKLQAFEQKRNELRDMTPIIFNWYK